MEELEAIQGENDMLIERNRELEYTSAHILHSVQENWHRMVEEQEHEVDRLKAGLAESDKEKKEKEVELLHLNEGMELLTQELQRERADKEEYKKANDSLRQKLMQFVQMEKEHLQTITNQQNAMSAMFKALEHSKMDKSEWKQLKTSLMGTHPAFNDNPHQEEQIVSVDEEIEAIIDSMSWEVLWYDSDGLTFDATIKLKSSGAKPKMIITSTKRGGGFYGEIYVQNIVSIESGIQRAQEKGSHDLSQEDETLFFSVLRKEGCVYDILCFKAKSASIRDDIVKTIGDSIAKTLADDQESCLRKQTDSLREQQEELEAEIESKRTESVRLRSEADFFKVTIEMQSSTSITNEIREQEKRKMEQPHNLQQMAEEWRAEKCCLEKEIYSQMVSIIHEHPQPKNTCNTMGNLMTLWNALQCL